MDLNTVVLVTSLVLLLTVVAVRVSTRAGLPSLLLYLVIGLGLGQTGLGLQLDDVDMVMLVATILLAFILGEGGFSTDWSQVRTVVRISGLLATLGVGISVAVTSLLTYLLIDVDVRTAVLLGAVIGSTDAAATFSVLRRLPINHRIRTLVEAESGFNDPPVIVLVTVVVSDAWGAANPFLIGGMIVYQLVVGAVVGIAIAWAGQWLLRHIALPAAGLYPLATMAIGFLAFGVSGLLGASGLMSIYVAGIFLGNADLPHRQATQAFSSGMGWLAEIGLFILLGLLADPARLPAALLTAGIVGMALTFVARPFSVLVCTMFAPITVREQVFISWAGLRGAVPIMLATIPMSVGLESAERVFDVVFVLVVVFTLIQAPTLPIVARRTGVVEEINVQNLEVESAPLENMGASLLQFTIPPGSRLHGVYPSDLRLPPRATLALIHRDQTLIAPDRNTTLRVGDHLLLAVPNNARMRTEERLRLIDEHGRLAKWYQSQDGSSPSAAPMSLPAVEPPGAVRRSRAKLAHRAQQRRPGRPVPPAEPPASDPSAAPAPD